MCEFVRASARCRPTLINVVNTKLGGIMCTANGEVKSVGMCAENTQL